MSASSSAIAVCLYVAAQFYQVPPGVLLAILHVEGGAVGQEVGPNSNGSYDLGPMQINTLWLPELAEAWNTDVRTARKMVRDDGCTNIAAGAWILKQKISTTGSLWGGIAGYHSLTPRYGNTYASKVASVMRRHGLTDRMDQLASR